MARRSGSRKTRHMKRKATRKSTRKQAGGGQGQSYSFGAPIVPGLGNSAEVVPMSSCGAASRPGFISFPSTGLGLPGLSGGGRRRRARSQRGGRYSFDLSAPVAGGTPWGSGIPPVMRIPCEASTATMRGGASDNVGYFAPTAGYSNGASTWVGSTGAPSMVQTPYDARAMNPACTKTGGGRKRRATGKKTRRHRRR
jgi:hypothetical protein